MKGHGFHPSIVIPGSSLGKDIFGDNLIGEAVNFFNPLADAQDTADLIQASEESLSLTLEEWISQQLFFGAQEAELSKLLKEAEEKRQNCGTHGEACPEEELK